jgi:OmpR-family two-component system manganese-sensing sensor histidine kinase
MKSHGTLVPWGLERRLLASFVGAFAVVIVLFAAAVRFSFATILAAETTARLETLARAGTAAVLFQPEGYTVSESSFGGLALRAELEGLEWFDRSGRLLSRRGRTPEPPPPPRAGRQRFAKPRIVLDTYTVALVDQHGGARGYVRASELYSPATDPARALDLGLVAGAAIALLAGSLGGVLLARASVNQAQESYERLREFTADASHELRGPLAALASTASVAVREAPELSPVTRRRLDDIAELSQNMRRLVDDLLILARSGRSMERELFVVELDQIAAKVRRQYGELAERNGVNLDFTGPAGLELYGNPDQIERIVANLVENAVRYTNAGGTASVSWNSDPARIQIAVTDTGQGIAPEHIGRIFDRFWRADPARGPDGGSGLGLAIALALARRHGGDVTVTSELGRGSAFTVVLPRRPPSLG